jgi:hypothetical protein
MVTVTAVTILILTISSQQQLLVFAMHNSTLDVNTWIASDNSTQLHTIDLNNCPVSSTSTAEGGETGEGDITGRKKQMKNHPQMKVKETNKIKVEM